MKKMVKGFLLVLSACLFLCTSANAAVVASTDFNGRSVSGTTASNLNWIVSGVADPGSLSVEDSGALSPALALFTTTAAQNRFAVNRNIQNEGSWWVNIALDILPENDIELTTVMLDALIFNNSGALQTVQRDLDLKISLFDSEDTLLDSDEALNIYLPDGAISQPQAVSFDLTGNTLLAGNSYYLSILAFSNDTRGNNAGFDNLVINGNLLPVSVPVPASVILFAFGLIGLARANSRQK